MIPCRLCGGETERRFSLRVLDRLDVGYFECRRCHSLQTQPPTWLGDAYGQHLSHLDTGAAQRLLRNLSAAFTVSKVLGCRNVIDYGGGDGLLCRFLRDYGINCFVQDKHSASPYAQAYRTPDFDQADLVLAFEVVEHFADPRLDLAGLFAMRPKALLLSTGLYEQHGPDWWYLSPDTGQHVFFYSRDAIELIAKQYGYAVVIDRDLVLFVDPNAMSRVRVRVARWLFNRWIRRCVRGVLMFLPAPGVWADFRRLKPGQRDNTLR